jgi:hypothetical protein
MNKRPIDLMRESGGAFKIESNSDDTPIQEMCTLNGGLALITKNAIYEIRFADQIDPKRENPNLPHNVQSICVFRQAEIVVFSSQGVCLLITLFKTSNNFLMTATIATFPAFPRVLKC